MDRNIRRISLVLQLSEAFSGEPVDDRAEVADDFGAKPVHKPGGFYVFTGEMPEYVQVSSDFFCDARVKVIGARQRLQLVQRRELWPKGTTAFRVKVEPGETVHLYSGRRSYKLNADISQGDTVLSLHKTDFNDITWLYHALRRRDGSFGEPFLITGSLGGGSYSVEAAFNESIARAGNSIVPLCSMTADGAGELLFPIPAEDSPLCVFRKTGATELFPIKAEINNIDLEV